MRHTRPCQRRPQPGVLMLALLALCALLGGGGIAQAHVHPLHATARDGTDRSTTLATADADCALCYARAAFEPLLPDAVPTAIAAVPAAAIRPIQAVAAYPRPAPRGHGWSSRAPPIDSPL